LSVDDASQIIAALKQRFPHIVGPRKDDICYATQTARRREDAGPAMRRGDRGRFAQQLESTVAAKSAAIRSVAAYMVHKMRAN